ncbi:hypothetical protein L195_g064224, partial [Trifolium pratense]
TISANLKEAEDRLKTVSEERDGAVQKVDEQKTLIGELEEKLGRLQVTGLLRRRRSYSTLKGRTPPLLVLL